MPGDDRPWKELSNDVGCDIFALCTSSAERLRDLDLSMNKTL